MSEEDAAPNWNAIVGGPTGELLNMAWVILANVSEGDWSKQPQEWQDAVARWRDDYHRMIGCPCGKCGLEPGGPGVCLCKFAVPERFVGPVILSNLGRTPDDPEWVDPNHPWIPDLEDDAEA